MPRKEWAGFLSPAAVALCVLPLLVAGCGERRVEAHSGAATAAEASGEAAVLASAEAPALQVYKSPTCGCCGDWVTHVEQAGFRTEVHDLRNMAPIKEGFGVPRHLESCHTTVVSGYVIEGHVPADVIQRLLRERPEITGIAVPGMPMGSPGMEGPWTDPYDVIAFRAGGGQYVYESR